MLLFFDPQSRSIAAEAAPTGGNTPFVDLLLAPSPPIGQTSAIHFRLQDIA
jgi:hypothetical protein